MVKKEMRILALLFVSLFVCVSFVDSTIIYGEENSISFTIVQPGPQCLNGGTVWESYNVFPPTTTFSKDDCFKINGWRAGEGAVTGCCPLGQACNLTSGVWKCVTPEVKITRCRDYNNFSDAQARCNNFNSGVASASVSEYKKDSQFCTESVVVNGCTISRGNCRCEWKNNRCDFNWTEEKVCEDSFVSSDGQCSVSVGEIIDDCEISGTLSYQAVATWSGSLSYGDSSQECNTTTVVTSCGDMTRLPFFGWVNFVVACFVLGIFYILNGRFKKKH